MIYTREAHALDSERSNKLSKFEQPITIEERRKVAEEFLASANVTIPALLDDIDDTASNAYASLPDRFYLIGKEGKIVFAGDKGPRGLKPDLLRKAIETEIAIEAEIEKSNAAAPSTQ